jgi:hypothetical protein
MEEVLAMHALLSFDHQLVIERNHDGSWYLWLNGPCPIPGQPIRLSSVEDPKRDAYERARKHLFLRGSATPLKGFEELEWK